MGDQTSVRRETQGTGPVGLFGFPEVPVDQTHVDLLAEIAEYIAADTEELYSGFTAAVAQRVPREVVEIWEMQRPVSRQVVAAMRRGDMGTALDLMKDFAKPFAEARVPFYQLEEFFRTWEICLLDSLVRTYRDPGRLKAAIEARQRLAQSYTAANAQAYAEVYELTLVHLMEELAHHPPEVCHGLWPSLVEASEALGLGPVLPRIVAQRLVQRARPEGNLRWVGKGAVYEGPHVCGPTCEGGATCMTALLAEAMAEDQARDAMGVQAVEPLPGDRCRVTLLRLARS